jgi:hypothetical protein
MKKPRTLADLLEKHRVTVRCYSQVGPGWLPMLNRLLYRLIAAGWNRRAAQIKEKFGTLRFYLDGIPAKKLFLLIARAESLSAAICEECGRRGRTYELGGWTLTRCPRCMRREKRRLRRG